MVDYVKLACVSSELAQSLLKNKLLDFKGKYNHSNYDLTSDPIIAKYANLEIIVHPSNRLEVKGSLHKYFNEITGNGTHNFNDFRLKDLQLVIQDLTEKFGFDPNLLSVHNLEYGVNVVLPFCPNNILNNLICYKYRPFNEMKTRNRGAGKEVYLWQYGVKIYNKGLQYQGLVGNRNILRFEVKTKSMAKISYRVNCLSDLVDPKFCVYATHDLLSVIDKILIVEEIPPSILNKREHTMWTECINARLWKSWKPNKRVSRKEQFSTINRSYAESDFKGTLLEEVALKALSLFN